MPAAKPSRFIGGLVTTPMEAGPGDFASCINLYDEHGLLRKRGGMKILASYGSYSASGVYTGWGTTTEPASVGTGAMSPGASSTHLYYGGDSKHIQAIIYGVAEMNTDTGWPNTLTEHKKIISVGYWNGSAWTTVGAADIFLKQYDPGRTSHLLAPFCPYDIAGAGGSSARGNQVMIRVKQQSDHALKTINGQSKYWFRVQCLASNQAAAGQSDASSSNLTSAEHPILCVLAFQDRRGTPHRFVVYLNSQTTLKYVLDSTTLTASDGLEPDGTSKMFDDTTRVWAYYDSTTDRVIGYVEGHTWFYTVSANNGEIYSLSADDVATDTGYESVIGGLRSVIPPGDVAAVYDDRIFTANGQAVVWSSPAFYKDVWPNDNELFIGDDRGPVTALAAVGGVLAVFKRDSIWVAQSDGGEDSYTAFRLPGNAGCIAPRSVAVAGDVAYFLAEDGIYRFDGNAVTKLSRRIDGFFSGGWSSAPERAIGLWNPTLNQYRLFYPAPNAPQWVCNAALYVNMEDGGARFWPQGAYDPEVDEGFNATSVTRDDSRATPRFLLGDRYGCLWEMDVGFYDGATAVTSDGVTHRVNLGTAQKYLLRWVTPVSKTVNNATYTMSVWPDGLTSDKQTTSPSTASDSDPNGFYGQTGVDEFAANTTFAVNREMASGPPQSYEVMGRFIQMQFKDANPNGWSLDAVEIEATPFARMG